MDDDHPAWEYDDVSGPKTGKKATLQNGRHRPHPNLEKKLLSFTKTVSRSPLNPNPQAGEKIRGGKDE